MQAHQLKAKKSATKKRVGRGGKKGTYCGKGMKGQKSRSGFSSRATFEGGRSTLIQRTKKLRGFRSGNEKMQVVNLDQIEKKYKSGEQVDPESLKAKGLISKISIPVKILSRGEISKKIILKNVLLSKKAEEKIKKAK